MRLEYQIYRGVDLVEEGVAHSGPGGDLGHAEISMLTRIIGRLQPGDIP